MTDRRPQDHRYQVRLASQDNVRLARQDRTRLVLQVLLPAILLGLAAAEVAAGVAAEVTAGVVDAPAEPGPSLTATLDNPSPAVGEPFALLVVARWSGDPQRYLLRPPQLELPPELEAGTISATGRAWAPEAATAGGPAAAGGYAITYRIPLTASRAGSYQLPAVRLQYLLRTTEAADKNRAGGAVPASLEAAPPPLTVTGSATAGFLTGTPSLGAGALAALALGAGLVGAVAMRRRRRGGTPPASRQRRRAGCLAECWQEARRLRREGRATACLEQLVALRRALDEAAPAEHAVDREPRADELNELLERCRYGGERPPVRLLEQLEERLGRRIEALTEPAEALTEPAEAPAEAPAAGDRLAQIG